MDLNFDYREFQRESMEKLAKIYAESLNEEENTEQVNETCHKIDKILDCPNMEKCHPYLFTLDRMHIGDEDRRKIDELYNCGIKRGFISEESDPVKKECDIDPYADKLCGGPDDSITDRPMATPEPNAVETRPTFSVLYSAMKDGQVKMGQFYSQAADDASAKEDCISTMTQAGYNNITVMAIEQNTDAVDQDVAQEDPGVNLYGSMQEDDSQDFEKQETGDTSSEDSGAGSSSEGGDSPSFGGGVDDESNQSGGDDASQNADTEKNDNTTNKDQNTDSTEQTNNKTDTEEKDDAEQKTDDKKEDTEKTEDKPEDNKEDSEDEDADKADDNKDGNADTEDDKDKKLTTEEKNALKDEYEKLYKDTLKKLNTDKSVSEMTIQEKIDFMTKIQEKWEDKADPTEFLKDKDQEKFDKIKIDIEKDGEKENK